MDGNLVWLVATRASVEGSSKALFPTVHASCQREGYGTTPLRSKNTRENPIAVFFGEEKKVGTKQTDPQTSRSSPRGWLPRKTKLHGGPPDRLAGNFWRKRPGCWSPMPSFHSLHPPHLPWGMACKAASGDLLPVGSIIHAVWTIDLPFSSIVRVPSTTWEVIDALRRNGIRFSVVILSVVLTESPRSGFGLCRQPSHGLTHHFLDCVLECLEWLLDLEVPGLVDWFVRVPTKHDVSVWPQNTEQRVIDAWTASRVTTLLKTNACFHGESKPSW